jgi:hypothetical protein
MSRLAVRVGFSAIQRSSAALSGIWSIAAP